MRVHYIEKKEDRLNEFRMAIRNADVIISTRYPNYFSTLDETGSENLDPAILQEILVVLSTYHQKLIYEVNSDLDKHKQKEQMVTSNLEHDIAHFNAQSRNYHYYKEIWDSASSREKYILYDIAEDRFANTKNTNAVLYLMRKGLVKWDKSKDELILMDEGFRTFLMTIVRRQEGRKIEREMSVRGTWSSLKFILFGIMGAILVFLALGNPDFFTDFNTIITLVASVVALFPVLSGLFSVNEDQN